MRALLLTMVAGCSMYGAKPAHLAEVKAIKHPAVAEPPLEKPKYIEACTIYLHDPPSKVPPRHAAAAQRVAQGDQKVVAAAKAGDAKAKEQLILEGLRHYQAALALDPYDAEATLQLARLYDETLRKGCALKLLDRLSALARNPKLSPRAAGAVGDVQAHDEWFKDYRSDATDAVQGVRTTP